MAFKILNSLGNSQVSCKHKISTDAANLHTDPLIPLQLKLHILSVIMFSPVHLRYEEMTLYQMSYMNDF